MRFYFCTAWPWIYLPLLEMLLVMLKRLGARLLWAGTIRNVFNQADLNEVFKLNSETFHSNICFSLFNELDISTTEEHIDFECPESVLKLHVVFSKNTTKKREN